MTSLDLGPLGAFATSTRLRDVPDEVVDGARLLLLDTLGALVGGLRYPPVQALARTLSAGAGAGPLGDLPFARLVSLGTAATWLDADSGGSFHPQGHRVPPVPTAHPAPHVLPVLLHEAASRGTADADLLLVFLLATEVGMRGGVATSLRPGLHPHGVHGPGAAAVAATLLRRGSAEDVVRAFELGSCMPLAATLQVPVLGGTVRNLWTGLGTYYGASAAAWAAAGAAAPVAGYQALFDSTVATDLVPEQLTGDLGRRWEVVNSYLKPYACARWVHPALDAVAQAVADERLAPDDVESVEVTTFAFAASLDATAVRSDLHARFSVPFCVAALLTDRHLHAGSFLPDGLGRSDVVALAHRVTVREDPSFSAALPRERPTRVVVRTRDGRELSGAVRNARGNPDHPLAPEEVATKFRHGVDGMLPVGLADDLVEAVLAGPAGSKVLATAATTVLAAAGL